MLPRPFVAATLRTLDWLIAHTLPPDETPTHQQVGRRGEEAAYFHLRKLGYTMIARNFRSPNCRGEIDLIGWEEDVLCFIEVKTRSTRDVKPGEAAVDQHKRREIAAMTRDFLRHQPPWCQWRFDIVSVYYEEKLGAPRSAFFSRRGNRPHIEVFFNCSLGS